MSSTLTAEVIEHFEALPYNLQEQIVSLVRTLDLSLTQDASGKKLLRFAGAIPETDLQAMRDAIETGCEQVDIDECRYRLDTNIVIALFAGESVVMKRLEAADDVFVPCIVLGELQYGARNSSRASENIAKIDELRTTTNVLECDAITASHYGEVKFGLKQKGSPIPENDVWIAAIAQQHDLTIASRDRHFEHVDAITLEIW